MSDACCAHDDPAHHEEAETEPVGFWQVSEVRFATAAGALLAVGWFIHLLEGSEWLTTVVSVVALGLAGWTFVPSTVRQLAKGRIGVGTLMTIAAIGAVALGQFAEAALLGILFSIAEGLEHYAVTRTRRGLRALLGLVPPAASVLRDGREVTDLMARTPGLVAKDGAEAVFAAGAADGTGVAVKISDGAPFARARSAEAQEKVQDALGSLDVMDPTSEVSRFEEKVRREEARVRGAQELSASSLDAQFESLEDLSRESEVEARLAALKKSQG